MNDQSNQNGHDPTILSEDTNSHCPSRRYSRTQPWVIALIIATCLRVWIGPAPIESIAQAQIPNAGSQRLELITEVRKTNELLSRIAVMLESGTLKVELAGTDKHVGQGASTRGK